MNLSLWNQSTIYWRLDLTKCLIIFMALGQTIYSADHLSSLIMSFISSPAFMFVIIPINVPPRGAGLEGVPTRSCPGLSLQVVGLEAG